MKTLEKPAQFTKLASALEANNIKLTVLENKYDVLALIEDLIPAGASVVNGSSVSLREVGYIAHLKEGRHGWRNLQEEVLAEKDMGKQARLRKESSIADYYLGSVHALTEDGQLVISSASGSQLPAIAFNASNLIFVVGSQKIVPDLNAAFERIQKKVIPLEDDRMRKEMGMGTLLAKTLIIHMEPPFMGRKVHVILVEEPTGF